MNRIQLRFGQAVGLKELIATLVVSGVLLIVGTVVFAQVRSSIQADDLGTEANATMADIEGTTYDAFQLATVALIVNINATIIGDYYEKIPVLSGNPTFSNEYGNPNRTYI